jgi:hypothetical protein
MASYYQVNDANSNCPKMDESEGLSFDSNDISPRTKQARYKAKKMMQNYE